MEVLHLAAELRRTWFIVDVANAFVLDVPAQIRLKLVAAVLAVTDIQAR
jgi:hypothetical protein